MHNMLNNINATKAAIFKEKLENLVSIKFSLFEKTLIFLNV